jgi:hypothetical protein
MALPLVIYIGGYGRSGSTPLDLMLGTAPRTLGAGELYRLWRGRLEDQCIHSERRPLVKFVEFWTEVEAAVGIPRATAERIRSDFESVEKFNLLRTGQRSFDDYRRMMLRLFSVLGECGFDYVIDSSKNSWAAAYRSALLRECGVPLYFVHLQRGFLDTMRAVARGSNKELLGGRHDPFHVPRNAVGFHLAHAIARRCREGGSYFALPFKRFMENPASYVSHICGAVGMEAKPITERLALGKPFPVGYQIGGNRLLKSGEMVFRCQAAPSEHRPAASHSNVRCTALDQS